MKTLVNHGLSAALWSAGVLAGAVSVLIDQAGAVPFVLVGAAAFFAGPAHLLRRNLAARRLARHMQVVAVRHGLPWAEPELVDGHLVWTHQDETLEGHRFVTTSILEPHAMRDEDIVDYLSKPTFNQEHSDGT